MILAQVQPDSNRSIIHQLIFQFKRKSYRTREWKLLVHNRLRLAQLCQVSSTSSSQIKPARVSSKLPQTKWQFSRVQIE